LNIGYKVKLRGYLKPDQLKKEYESAAIFVLPSTAESFGMVLIEAMSAGCAVITSDTSGCAEVVGDAALLVRPKDSEGIKKHLLTLINDSNLRKGLGKRGRERVENEFTWNSVAQRYIELYKKVLGGG
jgi:glycosyltransferase involved in cell wall biosynthesis